MSTLKKEKILARLCGSSRSAILVSLAVSSLASSLDAARGLLLAAASVFWIVSSFVGVSVTLETWRSRRAARELVVPFGYLALSVAAAAAPFCAALFVANGMAAPASGLALIGAVATGTIFGALARETFSSGETTDGRPCKLVLKGTLTACCCVSGSECVRLLFWA